MEHVCPHLAELVRINDTLTWSRAYQDSFVAAVEIIRGVVGARLAPSFLLDDTGTRLVRVTDDRQSTILGESFDWMPVGPYVRAPWINPGEWPVSARDHLGGEAWDVLPTDFKAWFGTWGIVVPIHADGHHLGAVLIAFDDDYVLTDGVRDFLAVAGRILGSALYRWQVAAHEREIGALEERRRIAEELHDDFSQQVASLGLRTEATLLDLAAGEDARARQDVEELTVLVEGLKRTLRHEMLGLRADARADEGTFLARVEEHLHNFRDQLGMPVMLVCPRADAAESVPLDIGSQLLRVLQESLVNAYRHSGATGVTIRLLPTRTKVRLEVEDDGAGFDPAEVPVERMGLRIMRQRMEQVDGSLEVLAVAPHGTLVVAEAPLKSEDRSVLRVTPSVLHVDDHV